MIHLDPHLSQEKVDVSLDEFDLESYHTKTARKLPINKMDSRYATTLKSKKDLRRCPGFDPITFTFSENSNYGRERCKGKTLLGVVNKLLNTKSLLTMPNNIFPYYLK